MYARRASIHYSNLKQHEHKYNTAAGATSFQKKEHETKFICFAHIS